jgi:hypothetical protein
MTSCFLAIRVRSANRNIPRAPDGQPPARWLVAQWPAVPMNPAGEIVVFIYDTSASVQEHAIAEAALR